jgi:hypothetical protein
MPFVTLPPTEESGLEAWPGALPEPLVVAILDGPDEREGRTTAIVTQGFKYIHQPSDAEVVVPESYVTDFASIPAIARGLFPPFGRHAKAAVLHDWLYHVGQPGLKDFSDRIFLDAMDELGVSWARRQTMYRAVRLGGGGGYRKAEEDPSQWTEGFGDWRTGDRCPPPNPRADYFTNHWPKPPRDDYKP